MTPHFTKTQIKILEVLKDGEPHRRQELWACVPSVSGMDESQLKEFARHQTNVHISGIRSKIRPLGQDIVCTVMDRSLGYRWVKHLNGDARKATGPKTLDDEAYSGV